MNFEVRGHSRNKHGCLGGLGDTKASPAVGPVPHGCVSVGVFSLAPHIWKNWEKQALLYQSGASSKEAFLSPSTSLEAHYACVEENMAQGNRVRAALTR